MHPTLSFAFGVLTLAGLLGLISTVCGERDRNSLRNLSTSTTMVLIGGVGLVWGALAPLFD